MQDYYKIPPFLLQEATVALSPGIGFGEYGERYLRFALIENERRIQEAVKESKAFLIRQKSNDWRWNHRSRHCWHRHV